MSSPPAAAAPGALGALWRWIDRNFLELGREMRLSYLPPLMVYIAAGISGLTGIVGTFFVKEYLGLSAEFLAALGFWAGIPWALKMPLGHLVDLIWKHKAGLVYLGATLICASLLIMIGLLADPRRDGTDHATPTPGSCSTALLAPVGYVLQDVVADAMTVEAVPRFDEEGRPTPEDARKLDAHHDADARSRRDHRRHGPRGGRERVAVRAARSRWPRRRRPRPTSSSTSSR